MYKYVLKRLLLTIPIVLGVAFIIFAILDITPGDPASMILGTGALQEDIDRLNHELGYDLPFFERFFNYVYNVVVNFDFGKSYATKLPVFNEVISKAPVSLAIAFNAMVMAAVIGIPIGILSAVKQYSLLDSIPTFIAMFLASTPTFWVGMMLILFFSLGLGLLPTGGIGSWRHYVLPMLTLSLPFSAQDMRITRSSMLETIRQDYIRTARAKGAAEKSVIWKHAMKNALLPIITVMGANFGMHLGGAIVTETLFNLPGLGSYIVNGIKQKDLPVVLGGIMFLSVAYSFIILLVDLLYAFIDPRIKAKYSGRRS